MLEILFATTTLLLTAITLLPLLPSNHWTCRVWEFPRVQIVCMLLANILFILYFLSGFLLTTLALSNILALVYQLLWIFPYTVLAKQQVKKIVKSDASVSIKILTSNVLMTNQSAHKLIERVAECQPDVLVTLETNDWWEKALQPLHEDYPYRVSRPLENLYGMHVYSKFELIDPLIVDLIEEDIPSIHCYLKLSDELKIKCHFLHPAPPSPTENETATPRDKGLLLVARQVQEDEPTIVTGDLNDVAWSPTTKAFLKTSGLLDPRLGRGFVNTFHANYLFMRWPLDHIFHSKHFALVEIRRLTSIDSDHFPLFSELVICDESIQ